jgi:hypothetical protein
MSWLAFQRTNLQSIAAVGQCKVCRCHVALDPALGLQPLREGARVRKNIVCLCPSAI